MSVEILVHSQTGHCFSVAEILAGLARAAGHRASLTRIIPSDEKETDLDMLSITRCPPGVLEKQQSGWAFAVHLRARGWRYGPTLTTYEVGPGGAGSNHHVGRAATTAWTSWTMRAASEPSLS